MKPPSGNVVGPTSRRRLTVSDFESQIQQIQDAIQLSEGDQPQEPANHRPRRLSVEGSPARQKQESFEDKFIKIGGENKDQAAKYLRELAVSASCKKGLKPDSPNQDDFSIHIYDGIKVFCVFDGHGPSGHDVSNYVHTILPKIVLDDPYFSLDPATAMKNGFEQTHKRLVQTCNKEKKFDCTLSGTTATMAIQMGETLHVAHSGDSRAIIGRRNAEGEVEAHELTRDHKPTLKKERKRIESKGGEVKKMEGDIPHRVFMKNKPFPGLAMSRAIGDCLAASVGVTASPDVTTYTIQPGDEFLLACSDGV